MIETFHSALAFSIGVVSGFLPCCFVTYPCLFAYFSPDEGRVSRIRVALVCVSCSAGVAFVGAVITGGLLSLGLVILRDALGLGSVGANYAGWGTLNPFNPVHTPILVVVNYLGWAILTVIGVVYLTGRSFSLPIPRINAPQSLMNLRGYRGGFFYGVFIGGPGQAHCTVTILIPIVFLSLTTLDPTAGVADFALFTFGGGIPVLLSGFILHDIVPPFREGRFARPKAIY